MSVRSVCIVAVLAANGLLANSQSAAVAQPSITLTISAAKTVVKASDPMIVDVTVRNISQHVIGIRKDRSPTQETDYKVTVRAQNGEEPPMTAFHRLLRGQTAPGDPVMVISSSTILWPLDPGKTLVDAIDLRKLYLLGPGVYTIQVERTLDGQAPVQSNTITITVTP
jgi:hypothetical protein